MAEGMSAQEVGEEIASSIDEEAEKAHDRRDRRISITEAILLSIVALIAAWSGYGAAKWSTESRLDLAEASTARTEANRASLDAAELRNFDSSTFEAWFSAYTVDNEEAMALAERRFRPDYAAAFDAWRATKPETNSDAPPGPSYMPEYKSPGLKQAKALDAKAAAAFDDGAEAGIRSDDYVRITVFLATVLFLIGISTRFPVRGGRYVLVGLGAVLVVYSVVQLFQLPGPPG
jgi:hypothetical protein